MKKRTGGLLLLLCLTAGLYCTLYGWRESGIPRFPLARWVPGFPHGTFVFSASGLYLLGGSLVAYAVLTGVVGRTLLWQGTVSLLKLALAVLGTSLCYSLLINMPFLASLLPVPEAEMAGRFLRRYAWFLLDERHGPVAVYPHLPALAALHALLTYVTLLIARQWGGASVAGSHSDVA